MNHNSTLPRHSVHLLGGLWRIIVAAIVVFAVPVAGFAQQTTTAIRGNVTAPSGSPASGVNVTVIDTRNGRARGLTTGDSGRFLATGLNVGGPFTVLLESPDYASHTVTDIFVVLGDTFNFDVQMSPSTIEEITVTAAAVQSIQVAVGPSSSFNFDALQNLPSINRDIRDIIRVDPRVYIDESFVDYIQCLGANPRFNSLTVDGVKKNDNFGLNSNGYPTQRMPFPFDAIQNVSIELSPFDAQYGGFTACNINAVTRSGGNEWDSRVWMDYTDDSMTGDSLEGDDIDQGSFDETRYGFSTSGPIIRDKLFFFAAYEKAETADIFDRCAGDQSCGRPVLGVSQAQLDDIRDIANTLYQYDPGPVLLNAPNEDEKYLIRLDWNINDDHRAALTYNYNDGFNTAQSDSDSDEYEFSNHFYERGAELKATAVQLFSDWNERFSTEARFGYSELDNRQDTLGGVGMAEFIIETYADGDGDGNLDRALVYVGGDDSRQSNDLDYDTTNIKLGGTYTTGDHVITGGYEREEIDIFNLFLQHTIGQYNLDESRTDLNGNPVGCEATVGRESGCIDQFRDFSPDDIYYGNAAPSLDPSDAAALFSWATNAVYLQDEFTFTDHDFTIVAGLRYDWYTSSDLPTENPNFIARNGFSNVRNFDGLSLLQPRLGFNWDISDTLSLRGGAGLYAGGNPNVWLGNNYQNDGITQVQAREGDGGVSDLNVNPARNLTTIPLGVDGMGRPGYDAPQSMIDFVANGTANSAVNAVAPGFKIPSSWKLSLGGSWEFGAGPLGDGYVLSGDFIYAQNKDSAIIVDESLVQIGTVFDGRPIYFPTDKSIPSCAADPLSDPSGCSRLFNNDYLLDNVRGDDAEQISASLTLQKEHDIGLDWLIGYAYTESNDVNPMTSSTTGSNYFNIAVSDPNNPGLRTSNYEIANRFIFKVGYRAEWFGDHDTRFTLFGSRTEGRPYSVGFADQEFQIVGPFFNPSDDRNLLYMPDGPSDPNVIFDPGFDQTAFFDWAANKGLNKYSGEIVPRNTLSGKWWTKIDVRISQEFRGFTENQHGTAYIVFENIGNMLNDEWGVMYQQSFPRIQSVVETELVDVNATPNDFSDDVYQFNNYFPQSQRRVSSASLWSLRIGFNYNF
jgi:hypothetical protein